MSKKKTVTKKPRRAPRRNAFGKYLQTHQITTASAAKQLGVTRAYVQMLATGKASPSLSIAHAIEKKLTKGSITLYEWV